MLFQDPAGMTFNDEYNFVAYDPAKKSCTAADRSLIKRHAGKLGSASKKRRSRRTVSGRKSSFSLNEGSESGASSTSTNEGKGRPHPVVAHRGPDMLATRYQTARPPTPFPDPPHTGVWTPMEGSDWQSPSGHDSTQMSGGGSHQTSTAYVTCSTRPIPADSIPFNGYIPDPLSLQSEFAQPSCVEYGNQDILHHPQDTTPRPFGSFDSGFFDNDSVDFSLTVLGAHSSLASAIPALEQHIQDSSSKPTNSTSFVKPPPGDAKAYAVQNNSTLNVDACVDMLGEDANSIDANKSDRINAFSPTHVATPPPDPLTRSSLGSRHAVQGRLSPRLSSQWACSKVDDMLVNSIRSREAQGQLSAGSSTECLRALSECDEARSLWILNLTRANPDLEPPSEQPADVYNKAKTRLHSMTHRQQMDIQGMLIKLGIAEYHAVSFAREVTSLQQDVANRKCLGIWSKAEALIDHRLTSLAPGAQSILNQLKA